MIYECKHSQGLEKTRRKRNSWMMKAAQPTTRSRPSWGRPCGTRPCLTTGTTFSWSTWTWRSFCPRTASPLAQLRATKSPSRHSSHRTLCSSRPRPRPPPPQWSTSAVEQPPPFTQAWCPRTVFRPPVDQVKAHAMFSSYNVYTNTHPHTC